ncbi:hypothetical protein ACU7RR_000879 [Providencia stuartii]|uniref:Uncharacterized protein n=1 Tax=Providencia stuartii (strain MRSN 2154) TaxID=1157951 RepID=A0A140SSY9_PROSM|nr:MULTISPECIES: hypothetical protein [Providencia]AFH95553.1 hypothetical protein S70_18760 [Providencia stuartii MRSN 2154]MDE8745147.1 hypothetical protein [Providencia thailandensis]MDE8764622.1 hypothetical protein [Providencia thailandensis]MDE8777125.1 hypothetical protein [Providencia thailandensis]MDE8781114.1 hypothetical protein [Providencia thailandensis]
MTVVDFFTILGSFASAGAIIVSLIVYNCQVRKEKTNKNAQDINERKALFTLIGNNVSETRSILEQVKRFSDYSQKHGKLPASLQQDSSGINCVSTSLGGFDFYTAKAVNVNFVEFILDICRIDNKLALELLDISKRKDEYNFEVLQRPLSFVDDKGTTKNLEDSIRMVTSSAEYFYEKLIEIEGILSLK